MAKQLQYKSGPFKKAESISFTPPVSHLIISIPEAAEMHLGIFELANEESSSDEVNSNYEVKITSQDGTKSFIIGHTGILEFHNTEILINKEIEIDGEKGIIAEPHTMNITAIQFMTKCSNRASISYIESESE